MLIERRERESGRACSSVRVVEHCCTGVSVHHSVCRLVLTLSFDEFVGAGCFYSVTSNNGDWNSLFNVN